MTSQFSNMTSTSILFDVVLFLLSSLVTGLRFMSISSLVLELWQFSFIRDWPEIWKSEIPPSEFCPISGDWGELWIPNLARMSNRMLLNAAKFQGYSFNRFWVIKGKPTGGREVKLRPPTHPPRLGLRRQKMCLNLISFKNFSKYDMKNRAHTFCLVQKKNSFDLKIFQICQIDKTMKNLHWIPNTIVSTSMLALFWSFHFWWCQNWFI